MTLTRRMCTWIAALCVAAAVAPAHGQADRASTLAIGMGYVLRHLNPAIQAAPVNLIGSQIFASPLRFDKDWTPQPYLAESWAWQDDGKSLLLRLVPGARFHDGTPITSEDVAFSIMAIKANHPFSTMLAPVERVDTPTPLLAIVRLKHEHPALLLALSPALCPIMPKHVYGDGQDLRSHPRNANPVGSGPYRLVEFEPRERIVLERHKAFFIKERPAFERLVYRVMPDPSAQVLALERGEVDMLAGVTVGQATQLGRHPEVRLVRQGGEAIGPVGWLELNLRRPPFSDVRVRQAIAHAIDRDFLVRQLHKGTTQVANGPIAPGSPYHTDKVAQHKYDLEAANRLLDAAGLKRDASGTRFGMTLDYQPGVPDNYQVVAEFIRPQLKKVGIDVTIRVSPDFATWAQRVSGFDYDSTISGAFMWGDPSIGVHRTWVSSNIRKGVIFSNTQGYANPRVDALLEQAGVERNQERRIKLYAEFQRILAEDVAVVFTHVWSRGYAIRKDLADPPVGIWQLAAPLDQIRRQR